MQELWEQKIEWDEPLPQEMQDKWATFRQQLRQLTGVTVPRHVIIHHPETIELHAFSDASERAYGAAIYMRSISAKTGEIAVQLLCSKSRVAQINKISLPRI